MARLLTCGWETGSVDEDGGISYIGGYSTLPAVVTATPSPRSGIYSIKCVGGNLSGLSLRNIGLSSAIGELYGRVPFATSLGTANQESAFLVLMDGDGAYQLYLTVNHSTGIIRLYRGSPFTGTLLATVTVAADITGAWNPLEFYAKIAESPDGIFQLWLNENLVIDFAGDTANTANLTIGKVWLVLWYTGNMLNKWIAFDDVAFNDTSGSAQTGRCRDAKVLYLAGNADGASEGQSTAWDGSDGNQVDNWALTDERPPSAADYNQSSDVNDIDSFGCADVTQTGIVLVQPVAFAALAAAGKGSMRTGVRSGGANYVDVVDKPLTPVYFCQHGDVLYLDPSGNGAWTQARVNALEVVAKVT